MKQTAVQFLVDNLHYLHSTKWDDILEQAKEMEKVQMIGFHKWMLENDTLENAERFFHFSDTDMLNEYLKAQKL